MAKKAKRFISSLLALTMMVSSFAMANVSSVFASGNTIDVWDFGGVEESDTSLYTNHITKTTLDNMTQVSDGSSSYKASKGQFETAGDIVIDDGLTLNVVAKDRLYYDIASGNYGTRGYGTNGKGSNAYADGYTADGMFYSNGSGGEARRCVVLNNVTAGDGISVYTGPSNAANSGVEFKYLGTEGEQNDEHIVAGGTQEKVDFIAKYNGSYKVWFDAATNAGKPVINRIVKYNAVAVTGKVDTKDTGVSGYSVLFENQTNGVQLNAQVNADGTYTAYLTPGYTYKAILKNAVGFGFTNASRNVTVKLEDVKTGLSNVNLDVEAKNTYVVSGKVLGIDSAYDVSKMVMNFVPEASSNSDTVVAKLDTATLTYSATLEPDVEYTAQFEGINDYEVTANGTVNSSSNVEQDVTVSLKATYAVTGTLEGLPSGADVKILSFTNLADDYNYVGTVNGTSYTVNLRDGSYSVVASVDGYKTSGHVVVDGRATSKNILFVPAVKPTPDVKYSSDIYVGCAGKANNFDTLGEAVAAAKVMNPTSEEQRITIHIAPGTYREQVSIETPYITLAKEGEGEVVLTWYYGIGYKYYSIDGTGYYNEENAFDKFDKKLPQKWGVATYVKNTATGFKAENITFETSFSKYITDEEIVDGVESDGSKAFVRKINSDPTSYDATERATAIIVDADNSEFKNCNFVGSQDTLYTGAIHGYFKDCMIEGNTDYIFGSGNVVFDNCELRFCGYSDKGQSGYLTAARANSMNGYKGYLFRGCIVTQKDGKKHAPEFFGRPWDADAAVTMFNTVLQNSDTIDPTGWTSMSGVNPEAAKYKEIGTVYGNTPVDTTSRVSGTVSTDVNADATAYFNGWTPTYYTSSPAELKFATAPYFSSKCDVLLPESGYIMECKYDLGTDADASRIIWERVDESGNATVVKVDSAKTNTGYNMVADDIGYYIRATVVGMTADGKSIAPVSITSAKPVVKGSGSVDTDRPSGKIAVFLAGDSTVKDYSAGAINNSGANRVEGSWGEFLGNLLDSSKYAVMDYAEGGRSSKTFIDDGFLDKITNQMYAGDYLFIQFGHNDCAYTYADRYVPIGTPDANGVYPTTEGTYKYYLQKYIDAAKDKGATPVLVTPVSRLYFNADGTIKAHHDDNTSSNDAYVTAVKQLAQENGIECIDMFSVTKAMYEDAYKADSTASGEVSNLASRLFAPGEKTHHSKLGGFAVACKLAEQIKGSSLGLASGVVAPSKVTAADDKGYTEFMVMSNGTFTGYDKNPAGVYDESYVDTYWTDFVNESIAKLKDGSVTPPVEKPVVGDANGDKVVTADDAALALSYCLAPESTEITEQGIKNANVDKEDGITAKDAAYILQKALDSTFLMPVEQ